MGIQDSRPPSTGDQPKRRMVLRKIKTGEVVQTAPSRATLPPVRPPMPSRPAAEVKDDDNELAALPPRRMKPVPLRTRPDATLRPPPPPDSGPESTPIPLTRLHEPRGRYQSAIDMEAYAPAAVDDEVYGSNRDSSGSTTMPPLVASLLPPEPSLYVRKARPAMPRMLVVGGGVAILALFAVLGGVAVGQRVAHTETPAPVQVVTPAVAATPSPPLSDVGQERHMPQAKIAPAEQAATPAVDPASVESLPRVAAPSPVPAAVHAAHAALAPVAPPAALAVDHKPAALPAAVAPAVAAPAAAPAALTNAAAAAPASAPVLAGGDSTKAAAAPASDTSDSRGAGQPAKADDSKTAPAEKAPAAEAPAAPTQPAEDPLLKAMRSSLAEEQERARQR